MIAVLRPAQAKKILAKQEAEIWRIVVQSQPQANSSRDCISKIPNTKKGWKSGLSGREPA
jgi:hypothetical protein